MFGGVGELVGVHVSLVACGVGYRVDTICANIKNPAYGRHQLSRPLWIVGPIQIGRGSV